MRAVDDSRIKATTSQISELLYEKISEYSNESMDNIIKRLFPEYSLRESITRLLKSFIGVGEVRSERDRLFRTRLKVETLIAHFAVASVTIQMTKHLEPRYSEILNCLTEMLRDELHSLSRAVGSVAGNSLITREEDRKYILEQLQQDQQLASLNELPVTTLITITNFVLEKRFNEYRLAWIDDTMRTHHPGFMAMMPERVYENWAGKKGLSGESSIFGLLLQLSLAKLEAVTSKTTSIVALIEN